MLCCGSVVLVLFLTATTRQSVPDSDRDRVKIIVSEFKTPSPPTQIDGGPVVGEMLNVHYFPGVKDFEIGSYDHALAQFDYVIRRADYLAMNPRQAEYMSVAHYLRGMIYLYHAEGIGRHGLAKGEFEASIKWNPDNYAAYLELSRVYTSLGFSKPALSILQLLKKAKLDSMLMKEVQSELSKLGDQGQLPVAPVSSEPSSTNVKDSTVAESGSRP
jgi:hypothetical protein